MGNTDEQNGAALQAVKALGLALLEAGRSTRGATNKAEDAARAWGLPHAEVHGMGRTLLVQSGCANGMDVSTVGSVGSVDNFNCDQMKRLRAVSADIETGQMGPTEAILEIAGATRRHRSWLCPTAGGSVVALCVALQVTSSLLAAVFAALIYPLNAGLRQLLAPLQIPRLFLMLVQSAFIGLLGIAAAALGLPLGDAVVAVAVNWMLLVPLPQVIGVVVDSVNGDAHAAHVRLNSLACAVGGILIGAAAVVGLAGVILPDAPTVSLELPTLPWFGVLIFCVLGAVGNAIANSGGNDLLVPAAFIGAGAALCSLALGHLGLPGAWSAGLTAAVLGIVAAFWAHRSAYSATALTLVGLTGALLPGLVLVQGLRAVLDHTPSYPYFLEVAGTVLALGVGTSMGFAIAAHLLRKDPHRV